MLIDVDKLENTVKPQMQIARKHLETSKNLISSIVIPSDFSCGAKLKNMPKSILYIDNSISNMEKWVDTAAKKFTNAEKLNTGLIESLISSISTFLMGGKTIARGVSVVSVLNSNSFIGTIKNRIQNALSKVFSTPWISNTINAIKNTASKIGSKISSAVSLITSTGAKIKQKITSFISGKIQSGIQFIGSKLSGVWQTVYPYVAPVLNFIKTGASVVSKVVGFIQGVYNIAYSISNTIMMIKTGVRVVVTGVKNIYTGITNGIKSLISFFTGKKNNVGGNVTNVPTYSIFKNFFSNTLVGKWISENTDSIFTLDIFKSSLTNSNTHLSDAEWLQIKNDYLSGTLDKNNFDKIKQIRDLPSKNIGTESVSSTQGKIVYELTLTRNRVLEMHYTKTMGREVSIDSKTNQDLYPADWFSNNELIKKSRILSEAIKKKCLIIDTEEYAKII